MGFKGDTSKFKVLNFLYDNRGYVIAEGLWFDKPGNSGIPAIARRWTGDMSDPKDIGYPQTYGKPQWMVDPNEIGFINKSGLIFMEAVKLATR